MQPKPIAAPKTDKHNESHADGDDVTWNIIEKDGESSKDVTEVFYVTYQNRKNVSGSSRKVQMANVR